MFEPFPELSVIELQQRGILRVEDGNHGENRPRSNEFGSGETAFIRAADMDNGRVLFEQASKINSAALNRIQKGVGKPGDILFSSKGTVGKLARAPMDAPAFVCSPQTTYWRVLDENALDRSFLYAFMRSRLFIAQWEAIKGETDMADYASLTAQRRFRVSLPEIKVQRNIASVIRPIDDKIDLNRRMNQALEDLTAVLFRSWFVDFDPVVANAEGRTILGLAPQVVGLFPATFTDSELGSIPRGWRIESIYTAADVIYGAPFASVKFNTAGIGKRLIRIRDLPDDQGSVFTTEEHPKGSLVRAGDIVVGMDGEFRAYLWGGEDSWLNQRLCLFRPKTGFSTPFVRLAIAAPLADVEATELATTVIHLGKQDIDRFRFVCPPEEILTRFNAAAEPWYRQIVHNRAESRTLSALRETLLPKLLSGELRVKDVESKIAAVV